MSEYKIVAKIIGDSGPFEKSTDKAKNKLDQFADKCEKIGSKFTSIGKKATIGLTVPLTLAGKKMVSAASDYDENLNKIDVAFGKSGEKVKEWSDTAIKHFGLSKNQALEMTALFGDMATSMGMTQPAAADMSVSLASLAGDMASFKNVSVDEAMTALNGVFTGETESLKRMGIVMTEANLSAYALEKGITKNYSAMSQAEKVQLRYNYVMEMTKNAHGDYANTADGTANSVRTFWGSLENLSITLGQKLLPMFTPLIQKATAWVNKFAEMSPTMQGFIVKIGLFLAAIGPVSLVIGKTITIGGSLVSTFSKITTASNGAGLGIKAFAVKAKTGFLSAAAGAKAFIVPLLPMIAIVGAVAGILIYLWKSNDNFRNSIMQTGKQIMGVLIPVLNQLANLFNLLVSALAPIITSLVSTLAPIITQIATVLTNIVTAVAPVLITIIGTITQVIQSMMPIISSIINVVSAVISNVVGVVTPIVSFIAGIITKIMGVISPIVSFMAGVISKVVSVITPIIDVISSIFNTIKSIIVGVWNGIKAFIGGTISAIITIVKAIASPFAAVFNGIKSVVVGVFNAIKKAWSGLTGFVSGIVSGISSAFKSLVNGVKKVINFVIKGINAAIWIINKIPGVEISEISYLYRGTDNWEGGFARINEGGRGELVNLPNGTQVIPHDVSMKYAKEAGRNSNNSSINTEALRGAVVDGMMAFVGTIQSTMSDIAGRPIVLDTGALVGGIADCMDTRLHTITTDRNRRRL